MAVSLPVQVVLFVVSVEEMVPISVYVNLEIFQTASFSKDPTGAFPQ